MPSQGVSFHSCLWTHQMKHTLNLDIFINDVNANIWVDWVKRNERAITVEGVSERHRPMNKLLVFPRWTGKKSTYVLAARVCFIERWLNRTFHIERVDQVSINPTKTSNCLNLKMKLPDLRPCLPKIARLCHIRQIFLPTIAISRTLILILYPTPYRWYLLNSLFDL